MDERKLLEGVLEVLRGGGAEGDAWLEERRRLRLSVRDGRLEDLARADVRGLAVRAMLDGRLGFVHSSASGLDGARKAAAQALTLAASAGPRDDLAIPEPGGPGDGRDEAEPLSLYDPAIETMPIAEKEEWARAAEKAAHGVDRRIAGGDGITWADEQISTWIANTKGLFRHARRSVVEVGVNVMAEDAGEKQVGELGAEIARIEDAPAPDDIGRRAGERAARLLGGRPVPTGRYPVVFAPEAGFAPLVYLAVALDGGHMSRDRSWLSGRREATIGSRLVTVRDDGRRKGGVASAPFDAEGTDTGEVLLVDRGRIKAMLHDLASARRLHDIPTGSARREGYESLPGIRSSNLYLAPGHATPEEVLASVDAGLWVWGVSGWWVGLEPSNATFSSAANGLWIEKGKPVGPVARVTIAGTIEEILGGIDMVANDLVWDHPTKAPTYRVASMSVSGT